MALSEIEKTVIALILVALSLYDMVRFQKALQQKTGREVDVITADEINNENLDVSIKREGIVVYEREAE